MVQTLIKRYWQTAFAVVLVCLSLWQLRSLWSLHQLDFHIYYQASKVWRDGGDPYGDLGLGESLTFLYPAPALLIFWPLSFLELETAQKVWLLINLSLIFASVYLCLTLHRTKISLAPVMLFYAFVLQTFSVKYNLGMGQINVLVLFLVLSTCHLHSRQHTRLAGFFLGLAGVIKIWPLALLPFLLSKKQWTVSIVAIFTFLLLQLPWWQTTVRSFTAVGAHLHTAGSISDDVYDQSFIVALNRLANWSGWKIVVPAAMMVIYSLVSSRLRHWPMSEVCLFLIIPIIFAASPVYAHYLIYLYPCLYLLLRRHWLALLCAWLSVQIKIGADTVWYLRSYYAWWAALLCIIALVYGGSKKNWNRLPV